MATKVGVRQTLAKEAWTPRVISRHEAPAGPLLTLKTRPSTRKPGRPVRNFEVAEDPEAAE